MIQGAWTAPPPLWDRRQSDLLDRAVNSLLTRGIDGIFALGTMGRGTELPLQRVSQRQVANVLLELAQEQGIF